MNTIAITLASVVGACLTFAIVLGTYTLGSIANRFYQTNRQHRTHVHELVLQHIQALRAAGVGNQLALQRLIMQLQATDPTTGRALKPRPQSHRGAIR